MRRQVHGHGPNLRDSGPARTTVFASWEAPPDITKPMVEDSEVVIPYILGWDLSELERWLEAQSIGAVSVVAVDYVQLISDANGWGSLEPLRQLADDSGYRLLTGFMPHRNLRGSSGPAGSRRGRPDGRSERSARARAGADRVAIICGMGADSRTVIMSSLAGHGRVAWYTEWIKGN